MRTQGICRSLALLAAGFALVAGCHWPEAAFDRPFPLGQVTDAHWETQQTNSQASDFVFYDHEFVGDTANLTPLGRNHLLQVAVRFQHVPFPIVIEELPNNKAPKLDAERRQTVLAKLAQLGYHEIDQRVVIAPAIAEGITEPEGEFAYGQVYTSGLDGSGNRANGGNYGNGGYGNGGYGGYGGFGGGGSIGYGSGTSGQ